MTNCKPLRKFHVTVTSQEVLRVFAESAEDAQKCVGTLHPTERKAATVDAWQVSVEADGGEPVQFGFEHDGEWIINPTASPCGRFVTSPDYYGFTVEQTGGGCTAWRKDLPSNMYMLLTAEDDADHQYGLRFCLGLYDALTDTGNAVEWRIMQVGVVPEKRAATATVRDATPANMRVYFRDEVLNLDATCECGGKCINVILATAKLLDTLQNVESFRRMEIIAAASNECNAIYFG